MAKYLIQARRIVYYNIEIPDADTETAARGRALEFLTSSPEAAIRCVQHSTSGFEVVSCLELPVIDVKEAFDIVYAAVENNLPKDDLEARYRQRVALDIMHQYMYDQLGAKP